MDIRLKQIKIIFDFFSETIHVVAKSLEINIFLWNFHNFHRTWLEGRYIWILG